MLRSIASVVSILVLSTSGALAQSQTPGGMPPPPGMSLAASAAMRFPQRVQVSTLLKRDVLQPVESQNVLGTVDSIVRGPDGVIQVVMWFGGFLGLGERLIAVPVDAMVLVGADMEVAAFTPAALAKFPTFSAGQSMVLPPAEIIMVGLAKPSH